MKTMEWIKVGDKYPEQMKEVLVWSDRYGLTFATFISQNKYGFIWQYKGDPIVTFNAPSHWMPSPGRPKK